MGRQAEKSRLFTGCQATELNHFAKPFKMDLTLTNRRFNFDKFRVLYKIDCQKYGGSFQDYLGGVADLKRQDNPGFQVNTPGFQA